jgi:hypothetical protein
MVSIPNQPPAVLNPAIRDPEKAARANAQANAFRQIRGALQSGGGGC